MKTIFSLLITICIFTSALAQLPPTIYSEPSCMTGASGTLEVTLDDSQPGFAPPYHATYYNSSTGDYEEFVFTSNPQTITGLSAGEYEIEVWLSPDYIMEFCASVESFDVMDEVDILAVSTNCSAELGIIDIVFSAYLLSSSPVINATLYNDDYTIVRYGVSDPTTIVFNELPAGNYTIDIATQSGCTEGVALLIGEGTPIDLDAVLVQVSNSSCTESVGEINIKNDPVGVVRPIVYEWSNGYVGSRNENLSAGNYSVTLTDARGCTATRDFEVDGDGQPSVFTTATNTCPDQADGYITFFFGGDEGSFIYTWDPAIDIYVSTLDVGFFELDGLPVGEYCITGTDPETSCYTVACREVVEITGYPPLEILDAISKPSCDGIPNGEIVPVVVGGYGTRSYIWNTGSTERWPKGLAAGIYSVTVADLCKNTRSASFEVESHISDINVQSFVQCVNAQTGKGKIDITVNGETGPFSFKWSDGNTTEDLAPTYPSTFSVTITDINGCREIQSFVVGETSGDLETEINIEELTECTSALHFEATVDIRGGEKPYSISWTDGGTTTTSEITLGEDYDLTTEIQRFGVTVTDNCGYSAVAFETIECWDYCSTDCIIAYKTGNGHCTDPCDGDIFGNCDKIKIRSLCEDDQERHVHFNNNFNPCVFIGDEHESGMKDIPIDHTTSSEFLARTVYYSVRNVTTNCNSLLTVDIPRKCFNVWHWLADTFVGHGTGGGGTGTGGDGNPCSDDGDFEFVSIDELECEDIYECIDDPSITQRRSARITCQIKVTHPDEDYWLRLDLCELTCQADVLLQSSSALNGPECPSCVNINTLGPPCHYPQDLVLLSSNETALIEKDKYNGRLRFRRYENAELVETTRSYDLSSYLILDFMFSDNEYYFTAVDLTDNTYKLVKFVNYYESLRTEVVHDFGADDVIGSFITDEGISVITNSVSGHSHHMISQVSNSYQIYQLSDRGAERILVGSTGEFFYLYNEIGGQVIRDSDGMIVNNSTIPSSVYIRNIIRSDNDVIMSLWQDEPIEIGGTAITVRTNSSQTVFLSIDRSGSMNWMQTIEGALVTDLVYTNAEIHYAYLEALSVRHTDYQREVDLYRSGGLCSGYSYFAVNSSVGNLRTRLGGVGEVSAITLQPNPATTFIKLVSGVELDRAEIEIFDFRGSSILSGIATKANENVDISNIPSGVYYLRIVIDSRVQVEKFVKL